MAAVGRNGSGPWRGADGDGSVATPASSSSDHRAPVAAAIREGAWRAAVPGYRFSFPRDHASHPAFKTEWWYYTGHLETGGGETFGFELTFFRFGVRPPGSGGRSEWTLRNIYAAHFAVTDTARRRFFFSERAARGALGTAGAAAERCRVWVGDWGLFVQLFKSPMNLQPSSGAFGLKGEGEQHHLQANGGVYGLDLRLQPAKRPAIHGIDGVIQKAAGVGRASHYYSITRLRGSGTLATPRGRFDVKAAAWMDHEFGSNQLGADQVGWDWFSLQLDDGRELMLYQLRRRDGRLEPHSTGTLVERNGATRHLRMAAFEVTALDRWRSGKTGGVYPSRWRVRVPSAGLDLTVTPAVADQELVTRGSTGVAYWEGSVRVEGTARGRGYVELTGYAERFRAPI